jgi:hypothetical protein
MSTKKTVSLICAAELLFSLFSWLTAKTGNTRFIFLDIIGSVVVLGLLGYALFREQTTEDKSEGVPPKAALVILCGIGLWVVFCFYRELVH